MKIPLRIRIRIFLKSNRIAIRFFFLFILFFISGLALHYLARPYTTPFLIHKLNAGMSSKIINVLTPDEKTFVQGMIIRSGTFTLEIKEGCEGIEGMLLIIAAICAFQMGVKEKISGVLAGILIIYLFNLLRIIVFYYTIKYKPDIFDVMHMYIGQSVIIFVGVLFFIMWISKFARINAKTE